MMPNAKPPNAQPSSPVMLRMPPTRPISAAVGLPPRSSVIAGRSTSENRLKSVLSSDHPSQAIKKIIHW